MSDVTRLLDAAAAGDRRAAADLLPLVYDELRTARRRPAGGRSRPATRSSRPPWSTRRTSGWSAADAARWDGRGHFFAAAAEAMRRILVEPPAARSRTGTAAAGGGSTSTAEPPASPTAGRTTCSPSTTPSTGWPPSDPQAAELVKLRVFAGLTVERGRRGPRRLPRTADRHWAYARALAAGTPSARRRDRPSGQFPESVRRTRAAGRRIGRADRDQELAMPTEPNAA